MVQSDEITQYTQMRVANGGGLTQYKYDRMGRVSEVNDIFGRTVKYEYNSKGLRTKLDYPGAFDVNYIYDALGRLTEVWRGTLLAARYEYDQLSRKTLISYYNNTSSISYQYDLGNRLTRLTNNLTGGTTIDFNYANYDKVGNRLSMKIGDANTQVYGYDKLYQLTAVDYNDGNATGYYYDKLGNRTNVVNGGTTNYITNALNQYSQVNATVYTYDKNGNLTYDGVYRYYYDCENRLADVNSAADEAIVSYKYDYRGRRVSRKTDTTTVTYLYDGDQIIAEYNASGNWQRRYYYGPGIDQPICMVRTPGASSLVYYYHFDGLGSVVALSNSSQQIIERYSYDVFGEPNRTSTIGNRFMFTGREYDPCVGLHYYRARYYHPTLGRFIQTDPIGYLDGLNVYAYVRNNVINARDPFGLGSSFIYPPGVGPIGPSCYDVAAEEFAKYNAPDKYKHDNFMRHCVASCTITQKKGSFCAWAAGRIYEWTHRGDGGLDTMIDLDNNARGRQCASKIGSPCDETGGTGKKFKDCEECCSGGGGK